MSSFDWIIRPRLRNPIAVLAFSGWGDAGDSSSDAARFLVAGAEAETIGRFDSDPFFDFQVTRPVVSLDEDGVGSISWPTTELVVVHLPERDVLVVIGDEPNYNWKRFVNELCSALGELEVTQAVTLGAFIGQVPHTLPVPVVGSSSSAGMIASHGLLPSSYEGPTGIVGVITQSLPNHQIDAVSLWAAVPHYLSNQSYPPGVEALVRRVNEIVGLAIDLRPLEERSAEFRNSIDAALDESDELADYVRQLESEGLESEDPGEELVEEIERYLRDT